MHPDEIPVSEELVARLIASQQPRYVGLSLRRVRSTGTVNAIFRLGEDYAVRLPRLDWAGQALRNEWAVLSVVAPRVTLGVPEVVARGDPDDEYRLPWAIYRWIPGEPWDAAPADEAETARALAGFVRELHAIPLSDDAPTAGRAPLAEVEDMTIGVLRQCDGVDQEAAVTAWREFVAGRPWDGQPVWIHADLLKPNLTLVSGWSGADTRDFSYPTDTREPRANGTG